MALTPRLDLRQSQNLVMTPQLQQAIKLLQLSNIEVTAFVEEELERNPMLERDEGQQDPQREQSAGDAGGDPPDPNAERLAERIDTLDRLQPDSMAAGDEAPLDSDYSNDYDGEIAGPGAEAPIGATQTGAAEGPGESQMWSGVSAGGGFDGDGGDFESTLSGGLSLRDHLLEQLSVDVSDVRERIIGSALIDMLDESGWITTELAQIAEMLGCAADEVEQVLLKMQFFDPPGLFARDLKECLALQLRDKNRLDPAMQKLLEHLHLLAARDGKALMRVCGVDAEDLAEMAAEIRALNPKPATLFDDTLAQPVTPDVLIRRAENGEWLVELNPETMPRVLVNDSYFARVSRDALSKPDTEYLTERYQTANWLVKSLHQRATTIIKVAGEIVRQQHAFFDHGVSHLRPLVLRDIAEAIEMHESTVSRVTSNKFMATPRGLYELKYFFTSAISGVAGDSHSAESVRHRIKALIDAEQPKKILSDDKIVDILREDGIDIARRTVAKYREAMRIPSSVQRRREKSGAL
ncbi:MAG: RNA polymerase factor sigma-54 [Alphaproteobacteria bacterium]|nr:RNA polymerase factor sigma-54 [Alphaproteobacteria bacterium]